MAKKNKKRKVWRPRFDVARDFASLVKHFQLTNRLLTGRQSIKCQTASSTLFPAWTIGNTITFSENLAPNLDTLRGYATAYGLNYHELAHVLYTPATIQMRGVMPPGMPCPMADMLESATEQNYGNAFNVLEDQRIETLITARFGSFRKYLIATFMHYCIGDKSDADFQTKVETAYLLARGRRHLPAKLRRILRKKYANQNDVPEIRRIVDTYRLLNLSKAPDIMKAHVLIEELVAIMERLPGGVVSVQQVCGEKTCAKQQAVQLDELVDVLIMRTAKSDDQDDEDAKRKGKGDGSDSDKNPSSKDVDDALDEAVEDTVSDPDVANDMERARQKIRNAAPIAKNTLRVEHTKQPPPVECVTIARRTAEALRKVEEDLDPGWESHREAGRLNVGRAMHATPLTEGLWDEWKEGSDGGTSMEMVVLLDRSYSMKDQRLLLSMAAWTVKRASDMRGIRTTVLFYDDGAPILWYGPDEKADMGRYTLVPVGGNTNPASSLVDAYNVLVTSKRKKKILLVMTDGSWDGEVFGHVHFTSNDEIVENLNQNGVVTAMVFCGANPPRVNSYWHNCKVRGHITSMAQFPQFTERLLVRELLRRS